MRRARSRKARSAGSAGARSRSRTSETVFPNDGRSGRRRGERRRRSRTASRGERSGRTGQLRLVSQRREASRRRRPKKDDAPGKSRAAGLFPGRTVAAVEERDAREADVDPVDGLEAEVLAEPDPEGLGDGGERVAGVEADERRGTGVEGEAAGLVEPSAAAGRLVRLEQEDPPAGAGEEARGDEAADPRADDDGIPGRALRHVPPTVPRVRRVGTP